MSKGEFQRALNAYVIFYKLTKDAFQRTHNFKEHVTHEIKGVKFVLIEFSQSLYGLICWASSFPFL